MQLFIIINILFWMNIIDLYTWISTLPDLSDDKKAYCPLVKLLLMFFLLVTWSIRQSRYIITPRQLEQNNQESWPNGSSWSYIFSPFAGGTGQLDSIVIVRWLIMLEILL